MRANNLVGAHATKKWRRGRPDAGGLPDLLNRNFAATAPNQRWVADVTEFPTGDGKLYLAGIRDLFHRGIVGWDTSGRQDLNRTEPGVVGSNADDNLASLVRASTHG